MCLVSAIEVTPYVLERAPLRVLAPLLPASRSDPKRSEFYWVPSAEDDETGQDIEKTPEDERFYILAGET